MSRRARCLPLALALFALPLQAQQIYRYTGGSAGDHELPLGYPVPTPVESLTPVDGFRSYDSLLARLQSLALASDDIDAHVVGQTLAGRDIWAYVVGSPSDLDREGRSKAAFFINATTHAREWASPEVATGLVERFADGADDQGLVRYLLDNTRLVIIPVQNVDGFLQTQRYPDQVVVGADPTAPSSWPRDGRMRRKNMRGADELLSTLGDHLAGVDLNRNHPPFWATQPDGGSSADPTNLIYHGSAAHSEPEDQAMLAAAELGPVSRMRLGIDLHTFTTAFLSSNTGRTRLNNVQARLFGTMAAHHQAVPAAGLEHNGVLYGVIPDPVNRGIGTAAEYFAYQWLVPAATLELEPRNSSSEYGGNGVSHDGFMLPESQIGRVREAWAESFLIGFYLMAGPPHLERVRIFDAASGALLREQRWTYDPASGRRLAERIERQPLTEGQRLRIELGFSRPMRHRVDGAVAPLPGVSIQLDPSVSWQIDGATTPIALENGEWLAEPGLAYRDDSYRFETTAPALADSFSLAVRAYDMVGQPLDADPQTPVDWVDGAWAGLEDSNGVDGDLGGLDATTSFARVADDGAAGIVLRALPDVLGEGDRLSIEARLDAPAASTTVLALAADQADGWSGDSVVWAPGEEGSRTLSLTAVDDLDANGDRTRSLALVVTVGDVTSPLLRTELALLDNDRSGRATVRVHAGDALRPALQSALAGTTPIDLVLDRDNGYVWDAAADGEPPLDAADNEVRLFGNKATWELSPQAPELTVGAGGSLQLDGLQLVGQASDPTFARFARVDGALHVIGSDIDRVRAYATLIGGAGSLHFERSSLRNSSFDDTPFTLQGRTAIESSSLLGGNGATAALAAASGELAWSSVFARLQQRIVGLPDTPLQLEGILLQGYPYPAKFSCTSIVSTGDNLFDGSVDDCALTADGDRVDTAMYNGPIIGTPPPFSFERWRLTLGPAIDSGDGCPEIDQFGTPRPQTLTDGAEPRCEIGAVELGVNPYRGLWIPDRPGHGIDIETSGNRLFLLWYSYDADGQPTAYQAQAPLTGRHWQATLQQASRASDGTITLTAVGTIRLDFDANTHATLGWQFDARGEQGSEGLSAYQFADDEPRVEVTGTWYPPADAGWGASVVRRGEVTVAVLYYYDADGRQRWVLGTGNGADALRMPMRSYTGFCPDCDASAMPVSSVPAGDLLLHFRTPDQARVDADVSYPGAAGGHWLRSGAEFVPLNSPVDNRWPLSIDFVGGDPLPGAGR